MLEKIFGKVQNIIEGLIGLLIVLMSIVIFIQIIARYVFFYSLPWSEELSRYFFVWVVFLGVNLAIRDNLEIRIDFIDNFVKGLLEKFLKLIQILAALVASAALVYSGMMLLKNGFRATSPSMQITMAYIYICIPVGMALTFIQLCIKLKDLFIDAKKKDGGGE